MAKPTKKCAFCSGVPSNKGEHLWDDWLNDELPKKTRFNAKKRLSIHADPIEFVQVGLREQIPSVCTECNGGWMSALTARMKDRFSGPILKGEPFSLDARDAVLLAAFTFMKAVVKNHCYDDDPFFTRAAKERLRTSLAIPPLVKMWIAAYQGSARYAFHSNFHIVSTSTPGPLDGLEFFSYTYIAGNLALQLLAPRWKNILDRGRPLVTLSPNHARWHSAALQFWPFGGAEISWPPPFYLGDRVVEQFVNRFQMPINVPIS